MIKMNRHTREVLLAALAAAALFSGQIPAPAPEESPSAIEEETPAPAEKDWDMTPLDETWFDDAVFFGDSVSGTLQATAFQTGGLGKALFFCETSYTLREAVSGRTSIYFRGQLYTPATLLPVAGASKVFIMLGLNDVAFLTPEEYRGCWSSLVEQLREASPEIRIFFQSMTPVMAGHEYGSVNNTVINTYNENLRDFCRENGCVYVDIATHLMNEKGELRAEYCRDEYVHLVMDAGPIWVAALKDPANYSADPRGETA